MSTHFTIFSRGLSILLFSLINSTFPCGVLLCLYDEQNNTWLLVDMEFLFSCSTRHFIRSLRSLLSYGVQHEKRNFISKRAHVLFSMIMLL